MGNYKKNSITLGGAVGLGTGVMISAGIFALLGQVAELSRQWFPLIFIIGSIVTGFSAYSYMKMSQEFPSAGGIGMFLVKAYGKGTIATAASLMMAISMIINQSLVARTFGTYTLQLFESKQPGFLIPLLGVGLIVFSFIVNISGNTFIQSFTSIASFVKIIGLSVLALSGLWIVDFALPSPQSGAVNQDAGTLNLIAAVSLTILAFKGFTTITNSGAEITKPRKNIGLAISISIIISLVIYLLLAWAVLSNLTIDEIIKAKDYALAEAARPAFGGYGVWFTVILAIIATITGIIASVFAVSRMLAMLSEMSLIPEANFGLKKSVQKNTLLLTVVLAIILTVTLDLTRIASMGAILYLIMDMIVHFGVLKHLRHKVGANPIIVTIALILDGVILSAFILLKIKSDLFVVIVSGIIITLLFVVEKLYLNRKSK
ncbi:APC family permease [Metabacillus litoralis]|uniref:APC family permease n=1 Tax=Metabacillus litoralis TaxID=152268 RepID=UPI00203AE372|nr:APC family permease [Metabacillus litoralis]MCM3161545.1 APC family permease [Metabacillus litoralis]